jgi:hypothetical protein
MFRCIERVRPRARGFACGVVALSLWWGAAAAEVKSPRESPAVATVKALFALDRSGRGDEIFSPGSGALVRYFSPGFVAAWRGAKARDGDPPSLEGDPLSGQQESHGEKPVRFALESDDTVVVTLSSSGSPATRGREYAVKFKCVEYAGRVVVDDIQYPEAIASLSEIADRQVAARLGEYIGSMRKTLDHVVSASGKPR